MRPEPLQTKASFVCKGSGRKVDERFEKLEGQMNARFKQVDERFEKLEREMDARFKQVDARFGKVETRLDRMETLLTQILERLPG